MELSERKRLLIVTAPSGAGKTTIVRSAMKTFPNLAFSISACTRPKRPNEVDGVDYYFLTKEEFMDKVSNKAFIEWEEVYTNMYYGTLCSEIERIWQLGKIAVFDIDIQGALNLKKLFGQQAVSIFIQPPTINTLKERLVKRQTENDESIKARLEKAIYELSFANQFDYLVINDELEKAVNKTAEILISEFGAQNLNPILHT